MYTMEKGIVSLMGDIRKSSLRNIRKNLEFRILDQTFVHVYATLMKILTSCPGFQANWIHTMR